MWVTNIFFVVKIIEYFRYTKLKCVWAVHKIRENVYDIAQLLTFWVLKTMELTVVVFN